MSIHFIGIGGIGVSALARYYLKRGWKVSGSDLVSSDITDALKKLEAKIFIGKHKPENLPKDADLVIYSPAIPKDNPELAESRVKSPQAVCCRRQRGRQKSKVKIMSYPQALGELTKKYFTIAICGSHGKSTVAAMIGLILVKAGLDPTVIVGTKLKEFNDSNCRVGKSEYLVIEADEHFGSFLNYWPKIIVLTALESDHLDYYKNFKNYLSAFKKFIAHLPKNGILVANKDDRRVLRILKSKIKNQSTKQKVLCSAEPINMGTGQKSKIQFKIQKYSLKQQEVKKLRKILKIPGEHNVSNALAALKVARVLKIPDKISFKTLSKYRGSWRRFDIKKIVIGHRSLVIVNDYGHHPTEVRVTLKAAREKFPKRKIWCIFQPHQYQRTYYLFKDFVKVFRGAPVDKLIITDIYDVAGREEKKIKEKVNVPKLVSAVCRNQTSADSQAIYLPKDKITPYLKENLRGGEVVIIMGAGDIYGLSIELTKLAKRKKIK